MIDILRSALAGNGWLAEACARVAADPDELAPLFAQAGRRCGRGPLPGAPGWTTDEAARALLLAALAPERATAGCHQVYRHGDAGEKRAVLKALPLLDIGDTAVPLCHDAIRTNDPRLVAAALGPYARHLDAAAWRHGILKCIFMELPLSLVDSLHERKDAELASMLDGLVVERAAAGRTVPADALALLETLKG